MAYPDMGSDDLWGDLDDDSPGGWDEDDGSDDDDDADCDLDRSLL